jgi:hypothetical protein
MDPHNPIGMLLIFLVFVEAIELGAPFGFASFAF